MQPAPFFQATENQLAPDLLGESFEPQHCLRGVAGRNFLAAQTRHFPCHIAIAA
jgi:hypothetical protein